MARELTTANRASDAEPSTAMLVHQAVQFLRLVRFRKNVLFVTLATSVAIGAIYFAIATRRYESHAALLVLQVGTELTPTMAGETASQGLMPTYQRLLTSNVVLEGALQYVAPEHRVDIQGAPQQMWFTILRNNLTVSTARRTNILEITYRSKSREAAAVIVSAVVRSYLEFTERTHRGNAAEVIKVLTVEKQKLEEKLLAKEQETLQIRKRFGDLGIRSGDKILHPIVQEAMQLNDAALEAQKKRLKLQATLASVEAAAKRGDDMQQFVMAVEDVIGREFLLSAMGMNNRDASTQSSLETKLHELKNELQTTSKYCGPNHPSVIELQERILSSEKYLAGYQEMASQKMARACGGQLGLYLTRILTQRLSEAVEHEKSLRTTFEAARCAAVELNGDLAQLEIAEHDLKRLQGLHDVLLNQIASIDLKRDQGEIRTAVIREPVAADRPVSPRRSVIGALCLAAGIVLGLGVIYISDVLDDRFRSAEEFRHRLGVPILAMVRKLSSTATTGIESLQVHVAPDNLATEAFRTLRTSLEFAGGELKRVVVSSAEPGDGKTTVLANLAVAFAQAGKRTLLIDADMRRPGLTNLLALRGKPGLSEVLTESRGPAAAQERILGSVVSNLDVLPSGLRPSNPAELLASNAFSQLIAWAETVYDQVLIDGPPALAATDSAIIGRIVDGVVIVVRPEKNQRKAVLRAAETVQALGAKLCGIVINRVNAEKDENFYDYGSGYGYGYGQGYGGAEGYGEDADDEKSNADQSTDHLSSHGLIAPRKRSA